MRRPHVINMSSFPRRSAFSEKTPREENGIVLLIDGLPNRL